MTTQKQKYENLIFFSLLNTRTNVIILLTILNILLNERSYRDFCAVPLVYCQRMSSLEIICLLK